MKHKYLRLSLILGLLAALLLLVASNFFVSSAAASTQIEASGTGSVIIANFNVPVDPGSSTFMARVVSTARVSMQPP